MERVRADGLSAEATTGPTGASTGAIDVDETAVADGAAPVSPDGGAPAAEAAAPPGADKYGRRRAWVVWGALLVVLALPLLVALGVLRSPKWFPLLDMAQTELRVRDVWSSHPPLIGLAGRIGTYGVNGGSHPGPLSFYSLWPFYRLFGASSWALTAATVSLNVIAIGLALWIAKRRGGVAMLLGVAAVLALLTRAYGAGLLTLGWNPYLPVLWWFVFLLAVWSILLDDLVVIPVAVFAGMFAFQTHISYLGLVAGLTVVAIVAIVRAAIVRRGDAHYHRNLLRSGLIGLGIAIVVWIPPVVDQIRHHPGNLTTIYDYFRNPPESQVGLHDGVRILLTQFNPWTLLTKTLVTDYQPRVIGGSTIPGLVLLAVWAGSVVVAWRMRHRALLALDIVLGAALVLGTISTARIFGYVWYYLLLWAWGVTALLLLAIGWTAAAWCAPRLTAANRRRASRYGQIALAAVVVVTATAFVFSASTVTVQSPQQNEALGRLVGPTVDALHQLQREGKAGPYLLTFFPDPLGIGAQGYGLLNELDRRGFDVRVDPVNRPGATRYRVLEHTTPKTTEIHIAVGPDIRRWQRSPDYRQVAYADPRPPAARAEVARLEAQIARELQQAGVPNITRSINENLFMLGLDQTVPDSARQQISRVLDLGLPAAVFIGPPSGLGHP